MYDHVCRYMCTGDFPFAPMLVPNARHVGFAPSAPSAPSARACAPTWRKRPVAHLGMLFTDIYNGFSQFSHGDLNLFEHDIGDGLD